MGEGDQDGEHQERGGALMPVATAAPPLKVLSGNGPRAAVSDLCRRFGDAHGVTVELAFDVNPEVIRRGEAGEPFDVAVGNPPTIAQLITSGKVVPGSLTDFGRAGLGVAVRSGAATPDIATVDAFKRVLLASRAVAFPGEGASGRYFVSVVARLGIADEMRSKLKPMDAEDCVEVVARGEADMVVVVATRIVDVPGVDYVGPIPDELQTRIGFAAGVSASAQDPGKATALVRFLASPDAKAVLRAKGVEPV
jgi:molybdate transport system substrate-binding protein